MIVPVIEKVDDLMPCAKISTNNSQKVKKFHPNAVSIKKYKWL